MQRTLQRRNWDRRAYALTIRRARRRGSPFALFNTGLMWGADAATPPRGDATTQPRRADNDDARRSASAQHRVAVTWTRERSACTQPRVVVRGSQEDAQLSLADEALRCSWLRRFALRRSGGRRSVELQASASLSRAARRLRCVVAADGRQRSGEARGFTTTQRCSIERRGGVHRFVVHHRAAACSCFLSFLAGPDPTPHHTPKNKGPLSHSS